MKLRYLIALSPLVFSGCIAAIQSKQGLLLKNPQVVKRPGTAETEWPWSYGSYDVIWLKNLPLRIEADRKPEMKILSAGPGVLIPLPVIPWPPGIISRLFHRTQTDTSKQPIRITLTFGQFNWSSHPRQPMVYHLDPQKVILSIDDHELIPSSSTYQVRQWHDVKATEGNYSYYAETSDPYPDRYGRKNDIFEIFVSSGADRNTMIELTYEIPYADFRKGFLDIKGLQSEAGPIDVPKTLLRNGRKIKLWWVYNWNA